MPTLRSQIKVNAPAEAVFAYIADFPRHPEWSSHPLTIQPEGDEPAHVGSRYNSTSTMMGKHNARLSVVELDAPRRIVFEADDDTGQFRHIIEVQPEGEGSLLKKTTTMTGGNAINRIVGAVLMPLIGRGVINKDVRRIKERVEAAE